MSTIFKPRKTTYAQIQYNGIAGLRVGLGREDGDILNIRFNV